MPAERDKRLAAVACARRRRGRGTSSLGAFGAGRISSGAGGPRRRWLGPLDCHPPTRSADTADHTPPQRPSQRHSQQGLELHQLALPRP